ncbi:aminotransferase class I/II-fold pyridoxal phosphate-dependent enzyme [Methylocystis bryophila]|uniref:7-keto-8-aminopelargonate synthetase n=1 Tax=Methylocystis bryophila TaxID=655015 RepID=A0A1W6MUR3_9HYPH|nr:aminotransferase class I/II-fold pyridoxal phosphate-dependent enzyme [Methylocystis bryophila]ARN81219.1 7-keto-8-aminopelargonate synthetase [Methylocystis bryophila]BDV37165.1 8-amino-7-oxononanoate synthase [Methylocystis bryophila]
MQNEKLGRALAARLDELAQSGRAKGKETVICGIAPARGGEGPRYLVEGGGDRLFLRMNANNYLGMASRAEVVAAEAAAAARFGVGPGAVRFIAGTWSPHVDLERRLAAFHARPAAMLFSSAYAAVLGTVAPLISDGAAVISDELNHNCIINAVALGRPAMKHVYKHLDLGELERALERAAAKHARAIVITDGVFSMRGDHAPLDRIVALTRKYDDAFSEGAIVVVDDSHGVGALGKSGRGVEEHVSSAPADLLIATLGKAFGVNGGYVVGGDTVIRYLRETSPLYVYSNPIAPGEAAAAHAAVEILDSPEGLALLEHLRAMTARFKAGLLKLGCETLPGEHPVAPLLTRDSQRTLALTAELRKGGVLATGLAYPVVPKGQEEIRFQISADHTQSDIDFALAALSAALSALEGGLSAAP